MMKIFAKLSGHVTLEGKTCPKQKAPLKPKVVLVTIFLLISVLDANQKTENFKANAEFYVSFSTEQSASANVES